MFAEITEATLQALPGILDPGRDGYDDTADEHPGDTGSVEHLFEPLIGGVNIHDDGFEGAARYLGTNAGRGVRVN